MTEDEEIAEIHDRIKLAYTVRCEVSGCGKAQTLDDDNSAYDLCDKEDAASEFHEIGWRFKALGGGLNGMACPEHAADLDDPDFDF